MNRLVLLLCAAALPLAAADLSVAGPDGRVQFNLTWSGKTLEYSVAMAGKPVITDSPLGIIVDGVNLAGGAGAGKSETYHGEESYPWYGNHSTVIDRHNGAKVSLRHGASVFTLEIRAWNEGVAFRFIVPGSGTRIPDEATKFRLPTGSTVWYHDLNDHYEGNHIRKNVAALATGQWVAPPLTFKLPGGAGYGSITEGALTNYSGMGLQYDGALGFDARLGHAVPASWPFRLRYPEEVERMAQPAAVSGTITTPWRVILAAADLNTLVNSDIVHDVAAPPDPKLFPQGIHTSWIRPGRAVWSYLDGRANTFEEQKEFTANAARLGFEYNILEGFWSRWPETQLKELVDYAKARNIRILIWTSRKSIQDPQKMREFFELCRRTGVAGAKIDFFDHENKEVIDLYDRILRTAAEYQLVIDFHGANKPTGNERTYPNEIGLEGIRGLESQPPWAQHDVTLPFTRMLAGLADYTPMHFGKKMGDTTWPHQVADALILQAPLLCFAANPANILANPAVDVIKTVPSVWDETVVLPPSEIGDVAVFARRKGTEWFLAVTNGPIAKTIAVPLSFLGSGARQATLIRDTGEAEAMKIEHVTVRPGDSLNIDLRSGGGFVGRFTR